MKKFFSIIVFLSTFINFYCPLFGQSFDIQFDQEGSLNTFVEPESVSAPIMLKEWTPSAAEPSYLPNPKGKNNSASTNIINNSSVSTPNNAASNQTRSSSSSRARTLGIVLGTGIPVGLYTGALTFLLLRKGNSISLPPLVGTTNPLSPLNNNNTLNTNYSFKFGEEVLYYIVIKDSLKTPIYDDTVVYIKLPPWLNYKPTSTLVNNNKLTDKNDDDPLTYFEDDSLLLLNLDPVKSNNSFLINFTAKVLTQNVSVDEAFCQVKIQSIKNKFESEWFKMSLLPKTTIPKSVENTILGR